MKLRWLLTIAMVGCAFPLQAAPPDLTEFTTGSGDEIVKAINESVKLGWTDNDVEPSPIAEDTEWIRRVYLDVVGRIPTIEQVELFVKDKDPGKRSKVIDALLEDSSFARNMTTTWTNLTIGRRTPRRVSRRGIQKFFREAFGQNRPWNEMVYDLVSGEGHFNENGQVNYLLAQMQMPDDGVQATAKTTRLFMGIQVQCTQCHNHPFNDWKQDQFWQFNSFFRQMGKVDHRKYDEKSGRMVDDFSEIVRRDFDGPVFYEKRSGVMQVAYPKFFDKDIDPSKETNRRQKLAEYMTKSESNWVAKAMVNRTWGQLFGYGFTKPVDDMGPHNPASHPELLERLTAEFVKANYDVKQLVRWITNSIPYNLTSKFGEKNSFDNPSAGEVPLFSHMYMKTMTAEQLYDSLIVATAAHQSGRSSWDAAESQRQQWMRQFVVMFDTDENDDSTSFNGTIPQALLMMNGGLIENAISAKKGSFLESTINGPGTDAAKVQQLFLAALSRYPSRTEAANAQKGFRTKGIDKEKLYQDLYWALLNANEFVFVH